MGILLLGAFVGVLAGWRFKLGHRAFWDWRGAKASAKKYRNAFFRHGGWSILWGAGTLVAVWVLIR